MAYHNTEIKKGVMGQFSKITEEYLELKDAFDQGARVLILCELCDLIGAIEGYAEHYNLTLKDLIQMKDLTKSAFEEGKRQ